MADERKIGLAILGAGIWPKEAHLPAIASQLSIWDLKAVYSRSVKSAELFATLATSTIPGIHVDVYHDGNPSQSLAELLKRDDIVAVISAVPITNQHDMIRKAWKAGKHVLSEKPVAESVAVAKQLIEEYEQTYAPLGLIWQIAENFAHEAAFLEAAKVVAAGGIGKLSFFDAVTCFHNGPDNIFTMTDWRANARHRGGFVLDGGVHHACALQTIIGDPIARLSAFTSTNLSHLKPADTVHALVQTNGGTQGTFCLTFGSSPTDTRNQITVTGTKGHIRIEAGPLPPEATNRGVGFHAGNGYKLVAFSAGSIVPLFEQWYAQDGVNKAVEVFGLSILGTAEADARARSLPRRAITELAFMEAALDSEGQVVEIARFCI